MDNQPLIITRILAEKDYAEIQHLLETQARNDWNHITSKTISQQFELLRSGNAIASVFEAQQVAGVSIMLLGDSCFKAMAKYAKLGEMAFIQDVVVHEGHAGKGLGSKLLLESIQQASQRGYKAVYLERHEENLASAGMMRKVGFDEVETFYDPNRRVSGSRNTTVMKKELAN
ncbi:MAG: ribosomal protein S18 acetylase RimI-like enzyme [Saprospiraceae bacterium]|jgi:ribosomal protein S18 acetylase RimI-like enzyme